MTTWRSAPLLANGSSVSARAPGWFSTSLRHNVIALILTPILILPLKQALDAFYRCRWWPGRIERPTPAFSGLGSANSHLVDSAMLSSVRCAGFSAVYWNHNETKNFGSPQRLGSNSLRLSRRFMLVEIAP